MRTAVNGFGLAARPAFSRPRTRLLADRDFLHLAARGRASLNSL